MCNCMLVDLDCVVVFGGGYGLGCVFLLLLFLGFCIMGIVIIIDNGGLMGCICCLEGGIVWGDMCNCFNQLIMELSVVFVMFEYCFGGNGELFGYNFGNLMLKVLDYFSVWFLEVINLICNLLKVDMYLILMLEYFVDLMVIDDQGYEVYGEVNIDQLIMLI